MFIASKGFLDTVHGRIFKNIFHLPFGISVAYMEDTISIMSLQKLSKKFSSFSGGSSIMFFPSVRYIFFVLRRSLNLCTHFTNALLCFTYHYLQKATVLRISSPKLSSLPERRANPTVFCLRDILLF